MAAAVLTATPGRQPAARATPRPAPPEYVEDYGHLLANTTNWRSGNMSPHVPDSAAVTARVAQSLDLGKPDVVLLVDVPAMAALAAVGGGPITLPDGTAVSANDLTSALLVDAYADAGEDLPTQFRRRAQLQAAATVVVRRLLAGDVPTAQAARVLGRLAAGRHVTVWSARAQEQQALERFSIGGAIAAEPGEDLSHVSVNNIGSNKLDLYVDRAVEVETVLTKDRASVVQRVTFANEAPAGLVPYVAGFDKPGTVISRVELSVPVEATGVRASVDGRAWTGTRHSGPSRQRLATRLELPRGSSSVLEVRYELPLRNGRYSLRALPQPLAVDASLRLAVRGAAGTELGSAKGAALRRGAVEHRGRFAAGFQVVTELAHEGD